MKAGQIDEGDVRRRREPEYAGEERGQLRPGDRILRSEATVGAPLHDALFGQSLQRGGEVLVAGHVGEDLGLGRAG